MGESIDKTNFKFLKIIIRFNTFYSNVAMDARKDPNEYTILKSLGFDLSQYEYLARMLLLVL